MRKAIGWWVGVLALAASTVHAGPGEEQQFNSNTWHGLKGRLSFGTVAPLPQEFGITGSDSLNIESLSLMGDYYLSRPWLGTAGGLRATSGLVFGARAALWSSPASVDRHTVLASGLDGGSKNSSTLPYVGVGYTGLSSKGRWGLSADLGLMALNPRSAMRLGTQSLDDTLRDLRFSPLLQLGLSYAF
jgi:hypothetical protein